MPIDGLLGTGGNDDRVGADLGMANGSWTGVGAIVTAETLCCCISANRPGAPDTTSRQGSYMSSASKPGTPKEPTTPDEHCEALSSSCL